MNRQAILNIAFTVGVIVTMVAVGFAVVGGVTDAAAQEDVEKAQAYCYQAYGDADITVSNAFIGGGYHCQANNDDPHLHDVHPQALNAAYAVNQSGGEIDWKLADMQRYKSWEQRSWPSAVMGAFSLMFVIALGVLVWLSMQVMPRP